MTVTMMTVLMMRMTVSFLMAPKNQQVNPTTAAKNITLIKFYAWTSFRSLQLMRSLNLVVEAVPSMILSDLVMRGKMTCFLHMRFKEV